MNKEIITQKEESLPLSAEQVKAQVNLIQQVMADVMKKDEHYGVIPGTPKPTLYKAGAEKLNLTFRMAPRYHVEKEILPNGHITFMIRCELYHINTGNLLGEGLGICSTLETKYRYRKGEPVDTGKLVPKAYWDKKDISLIGGPGHTAKKIDGRWMICTSSAEMVENKNIADTYNTVLKIGKKRAHVDAVLTATAASDIFTQDLEDMPEIASTKKSTPIPAKEQTFRPPSPEVAALPPEDRPKQKPLTDEIEKNAPNKKDIFVGNVEDKTANNKKPYAWIYAVPPDITDPEQEERYFCYSQTSIMILKTAWKNGELAQIRYEETKYGNKILHAKIADSAVVLTNKSGDDQEPPMIDEGEAETGVSAKDLAEEGIS